LPASAYADFFVTLIVRKPGFTTTTDTILHKFAEI